MSHNCTIECYNSNGDKACNDKLVSVSQEFRDAVFTKKDLSVLLTIQTYEEKIQRDRKHLKEVLASVTYYKDKLDGINADVNDTIRMIKESHAKLLESKRLLLTQLQEEPIPVEIKEVIDKPSFDFIGREE